MWSCANLGCYSGPTGRQGPHTDAVAAQHIHTHIESATHDGISQAAGAPLEASAVELLPCVTTIQAAAHDAVRAAVHSEPAPSAVISVQIDTEGVAGSQAPSLGQLAVSELGMADDVAQPPAGPDMDPAPTAGRTDATESASAVSTDTQGHNPAEGHAAEAEPTMLEQAAAQPAPPHGAASVTQSSVFSQDQPSQHNLAAQIPLPPPAEKAEQVPPSASIQTHQMDAPAQASPSAVPLAQKQDTGMQASAPTSDQAGAPRQALAAAPEQACKPRSAVQASALAAEQVEQPNVAVQALQASPDQTGQLCAAALASSPQEHDVAVQALGMLRDQPQEPCTAAAASAPSLHPTEGPGSAVQASAPAYSLTQHAEQASAPLSDQTAQPGAAVEESAPSPQLAGKTMPSAASLLQTDGPAGRSTGLSSEAEATAPVSGQSPISFAGPQGDPAANTAPSKVFNPPWSAATATDAHPHPDNTTATDAHPHPDTTTATDAHPHPNTTTNTPAGTIASANPKPQQASVGKLPQGSAPAATTAGTDMPPAVSAPVTHTKRGTRRKNAAKTKTKTGAGSSAFKAGAAAAVSVTTATNPGSRRGPELVGQRIEVWFSGVKAFLSGSVKSYTSKVQS